ncbi:Alpha amylase, catalytic subdomain (fragment) [Nitrospira japonica]|uniref:Maltokinase n=1 Tax=Nitrospira japonica TaxID=1325564 RepID=A0A1W1I5W5_9BACT
MLRVKEDWQGLFEGEGGIAELSQALPTILQTRRWFGGKALRIAKVEIADSIVILSHPAVRMLILRVIYESADMESYTLPLGAAFGEEADRIRRDSPHAVLAPIMVRKCEHDVPGILYDALWNPDVALSLLDAIGQSSRFPGTAGSIAATSTNTFTELVPSRMELEPVLMKTEQSNTSIAYSGRVILKLYRRIAEGVNPDLEIGRALTYRQFPYVPCIAGYLEYHDRFRRSAPLAVLQKFVANEGDAWKRGLEEFERFIDRLETAHLWKSQPPAFPSHPFDLAQAPYSPPPGHLIGPFLESVRRLGNRTAQLHVALSQIVDDPDFAPEPLTRDSRRRRYQTMVENLTDTLSLVKERMQLLPENGQALAEILIALQSDLDQMFSAFENIETAISLIRCQGDYHLGQVLCVKDDFMIIDFEGEPAQSLAERRMKQPAFVDVAGMTRSFQYVPFVVLKGKGAQWSPWAAFWSGWTSAAFLQGYLELASGSSFCPRNSESARVLFDAYLIKKALYELRYELNNRPDWVEIPLHGLVNIIRPADQRQQPS